MDLHDRFVWKWEKPKPKLQHGYAMDGFALSVTPAVWAHAAQLGMLSAEVQSESGLELVTKKLHQEPNRNKDTWIMSEAEIVDRFWTEFEDFRNRRSVVGVPDRWEGFHVRPELVSPTCGTRSIPFHGQKCSGLLTVG